MPQNIFFKDNSNLVLSALEDALNRSLEKIGERAEELAKKECPVDTGRLRDSITHTVNTEAKTVTVSSDVEYSPYVELGTSKMPPKPFLKPAMMESAKELSQILERELKNS